MSRPRHGVEQRAINGGNRDPRTSAGSSARMGKKGKKDGKTPYKEVSTFDALTVEGKTPATAVLLLNSPEDEILIKSCATIRIYADKGDDSKLSLLGLGVLEPLCQLINHNNKLVRRNALMALGIMSTHNDVKRTLKKIDVIPSVIDKLSFEDDVEFHEYATLCLCSLSEYYICKIKIFQSNGLPPLIQLLSSQDVDVKKNAVETLCNLVQDYQSRLALSELGGIPPLLELMKSEFPVIQHLALNTLKNITINKEAHGIFREEQGFPKIMDILSTKEYGDLHAEALQVIANCLRDNVSFQMVQKTGGLTRVLDFVLTNNLPEIQCSAVACLANIAQNAENRILLHEQHTEGFLTELLSVENDTVKTVTCQAVAAMSLLPASQNAFRELGILPTVVQSLSSEYALLREAATLALSNTTANNKSNALAVYEAGGNDMLVHLLSDSCPKIVANVTAALVNLAGQDNIRHSILMHGAIKGLVGPLKSTYTQVLINSTLCLAMLACESEARVELLSAGGLCPLVALLGSSNKEVLNNACWAISICASDQPNAVQMCKFGALEKLQEINQSMNRRSRFSELAVVSLLNNNLSLKYSLTGCLASTDIITDGFYDAGKGRAGERILTLEELFKERVNQHRPVIVINTAEKRWDDDKQKDEALPEATESVDSVEQESAEKEWKMEVDATLQALVKEVKDTILPLNDEVEQFASLARLVSRAMGGVVEMEQLHEFSWELHLSELKFQLDSNVIPLGMITKGIYCHRALLYKCLSDSIGMSCTLVNGDYNRAWNEIRLFEGNSSTNGHQSQPSRFIVDLMHQPGNLLKCNSAAAMKYQTI